MKIKFLALPSAYTGVILPPSHTLEYIFAHPKLTQHVNIHWVRSEH